MQSEFEVIYNSKSKWIEEGVSFIAMFSGVKMVTHSHFYRFTTLQCLSCFHDYHFFWFYSISNEHNYVSIKQMGYDKFRLMA